MTIREVPYEVIVRRFGAAFRYEKLPLKPTKDCAWYASEEACGALQRVSDRLVRVKGTLTLPEYQGMGYGEAILRHLIEQARPHYPQMEVFARHPGWFLRNGWTVVREASWGTAVLRYTFPS